MLTCYIAHLQLHTYEQSKKAHTAGKKLEQLIGQSLDKSWDDSLEKLQNLRDSCETEAEETHTEIHQKTQELDASVAKLTPQIELIRDIIEEIGNLCFNVNTDTTEISSFYSYYIT